MSQDTSSVYSQDKVFVTFNKYPESLQNSWVLITIFDAKNTLGGVCSLYINDKFPKGTIIISKKIYNDYPDAYITFDKNGSFNRIYTSTKYRKNGIMKYLGNLLKTILFAKYKLYLDTAKTHNAVGHEVMKSGINMALKMDIKDRVTETPYWKDPPLIHQIDLMEYRDPMSPSYWYDIRYE